MISATSCASIFILTVISVERFIAIIFPLRTRQLLTARHLIIVISFVWISSAAFNVQTINASTVISWHGSSYCTSGVVSDLYNEVYTIISILVFYFIPLMVMTILYGLICRKLWVNTDNLHATAEKDSKSADPENKRFWHKIPPKVRYFVNSRGNKCIKGSDNLEGLGKSADKKDAECPDEVQILMEINTDDSPKESNQKVGPFLLDEASEETTSPPTKSRSKQNNGPVGEQIPLNSGKQLNCSEADTDNVDRNSNMKWRTQNSLPTSHQRATSRVQPSSSTQEKKGKKKNKREEVLAARKKVIRLLVVIVISFALCLFPIQLMAMWNTYGDYPSTTFAGQMGMPIAFWLYFFNSAINPFLYAFLSDNFRRKMKETLLPKSVRRRQKWTRQTQASGRTSEVPTETETMYN